MKELQGSARAAVVASAEEALALLAAVEGYPTWHPDVVRAVGVLERDPSGQPSQVHTTLHLAQGPLSRDFDLRMAVSVEAPSTVRLTRVPDDPADEERFDVTWRVEAPAHTEITLELRANLAVPRVLPIGGIGDAVANGFVTAAAQALLTERP